jgi:hypothetical protein
MTEDPWAGIGLPQASGDVMGRRVDPTNPFDCFWLKDYLGRKSWALFVDGSLPPGGPLPKLRGIDVRLDPSSGGRTVLLLTLKTAENADIFRRLCLDLVAASEAAVAQTDAVHRVLARTWRWHHLMRGGPTDGLSKEEEKGLAAELHVMERHLIPAVGIKTACEHWFGPLDGPKDFELGHIAVEVKARRGGATPSVKISSEHQLDAANFKHFYLAVVQVDEAIGTETTATTLRARIDGVRALAAATAPDAVELVDSRLAATGYRDEDDYSTLWLIAGTQVYEVGDEFPAIRSGTLPGGVHRVSYSLSLNELAQFHVAESALADRLEVRHE